MSNWFERDKQSILPTYGRLPIVPVKGDGCYITDIEGRIYLDTFSGLGVNLLGYNHPDIVSCIIENSQGPLHLSNYFYNTKAIELAEKIKRYSIEGKIFFTNSGAESTEAAIKYIYKYGQCNGKRGIVSIKESFHGRTLGALKVTKEKGVNKDFPLIDYPVYEVELGDFQGLKDICYTHNPAAIIFEPISGSGGVHEIGVDFAQSIQTICKNEGILLCVDEIQSGMGRTGRFFAYQYFDIVPDIILFAKGVGGGLPLGGILVSDTIGYYFKQGDHGTTFGPNYLASALGGKTIDIVTQEGFASSIVEKGEYFKGQLELIRNKYKEYVGEIRGKGYMIGLDLKIDPKLLQKQFLSSNILINITAGKVLRLIPPLVMDYKQIDEFIKIFDTILKGWSAQDA